MRTVELLTLAAIAALLLTAPAAPPADASPVIAGPSTTPVSVPPAVSVPAPGVGPTETVNAPADGPGEIQEAGAFLKQPVPVPVNGFDELPAGAGFTSLPGQPLRKVAHVAAAPVRFVRQRQPIRNAWQNRPRVFGRRGR